MGIRGSLHCSWFVMFLRVGNGTRRSQVKGSHAAVPNNTHWCALDSTATFHCYALRSSGTLPPFSASFCMTCLCSQMFIDAESFISPV